eukprot:8141806-Alexandrium_andersonii.AAC.1
MHQPPRSLLQHPPLQQSSGRDQARQEALIRAAAPGWLVPQGGPPPKPTVELRDPAECQSEPAAQETQPRAPKCTPKSPPQRPAAPVDTD